MSHPAKTSVTSVKDSTICSVLIAAFLVVGGFAIEELAVMPLEGQATPVYGTIPAQRIRVRATSSRSPSLTNQRRAKRLRIRATSTSSIARSVSSANTSSESWGFSCNRLQTCRVR